MSELASIPRNSKSTRGTINGVDRLSSLPDELLHHVMSFLPMPEVVRTSLLSLRWRNLWASMPYIRIDYQDFMDDGKLKKFGDRMLLLRDGSTSLDEARIFAHKDGATCCEWIRHAIMHKVCLLHVSGFCNFVHLDSAAMFPSQHLKTIRLQSVLLRPGFFRPLNCDCPVLEHLELEKCSFCDLKITSRSLKVLHIIQCLVVEGLLICARSLTHLSIVGISCYSGAMVTRDLPSLVTSSINLRYDMFHHKKNTIMGYGLLDGLSHATTLELHAPLLELAFERGLQTCPMFSNLTSLVLGDWCTAADFYPLLCILKRSPKLKELTLQLEMEECRLCKDSESALPSSRAVSGSCSYPCIERIKVYCRKEDPRVGALEQALLPIVGDVKISIEHR